MQNSCTTIISYRALEPSDIMSVSFDERLCDQNPYCPAAKKCPSGALHVDRKTLRPTFDRLKCTGCAVCASSCPRGAIGEG